MPLELDGEPRLRTVSLTLQFLSPAKLGDWVEGRAELMRATRTLAFVRGDARVGERAVLEMSGIFDLKPPGRAD